MYKNYPSFELILYILLHIDDRYSKHLIYTAGLAIAQRDSKNHTHLN